MAVTTRGPDRLPAHRAAEAAGIRVDVVAPMKKPARGRRWRQHRRKDAELLVRLLMPRADGGLGPPPAFEAARTA